MWWPSANHSTVPCPWSPSLDGGLRSPRWDWGRSWPARPPAIKSLEFSSMILCSASLILPWEIWDSQEAPSAVPEWGGSRWDTLRSPSGSDHTEPLWTLPSAGKRNLHWGKYSLFLPQPRLLLIKWHHDRHRPNYLDFEISEHHVWVNHEFSLASHFHSLRLLRLTISLASILDPNTAKN